MSIFSHLFPFQPRNKLFRSGFNFIYHNEIFFKYLPIFGIFLKFHFQFLLYTRRLEIHKIFRLSRNLTKFDREARF